MMGRVYYGRYYEYFESARAHFLRELGLPYGEIEKSGVLIPVIESHCKYNYGATFDDLLNILLMSWKSDCSECLRKPENFINLGSRCLPISDTFRTVVFPRH